MAGMVGGATLVFSGGDWNISEASASLSMSGLDLTEVRGERTVGGRGGGGESYLAILGHS